MPEIRELPLQGNAAGPIQGSRASTEDLSIGGGISAVGGAVEHVGNVIHERVTQSDISNNNAGISQLHSDTVQKFKQYIARAGMAADPAHGLAAGPDVNDPELIRNFMRDNYDSKISDLENKTSTPGGQNYLNRASARTKMILQDQMVNEVAHAQGGLLQNQVNESIKARSSTILNDPGIFNNVIKEHSSFIDELESANSRSGAGVPHSVFQKLKDESNAEFAKSQIKGLINLNTNLPGDVNANGDKVAPSLARQKLDSDQLDPYMNGDQKEILYNMVDRKERANEAQQRQLELAKERREKAFTEQNMRGMLTDMSQNKLSPQGVLDKMNDPDHPLPEHIAEHFIKLLKDDKKDPWSGDKDTYAMLIQRAYDPNGSQDSSEFLKYLGRGAGQIDDRQMAHLVSIVNQKNAPEVKEAWAAFHTHMAGVKQILEGPDLNMKDPKGTEKFTRDAAPMLERFANGIKNHVPASVLLNPNDPSYIGKGMDIRALSPLEKATNIMQSAQGQGQNLNPTFKSVIDKVTGAKPAPSGPAVGEVRVGNGGIKYRFKGGANVKENWEKVE